MLHRRLPLENCPRDNCPLENCLLVGNFSRKRKLTIGKLIPGKLLSEMSFPTKTPLH